MGAVFVFPSPQNEKRVGSPIILAAPAASITLNVSYQGYTDLLVRVWARSSNAAVNDGLRVKWNGSTTIGDYKNNIHRILDTTVNVTLNNGAVGYSEMGDFPASGGSAGAFGLVEFMVFNAFSTTLSKNYQSKSATMANVAAANTSFSRSSGMYVPTTPISSIVFALVSASNFLAGTTIDAYYINPSPLV